MGVDVAVGIGVRVGSGCDVGDTRLEVSDEVVVAAMVGVAIASGKGISVAIETTFVGFVAGNPAQLTKIIVINSETAITGVDLFIVITCLSFEIRQDPKRHLP